MQAVIDACKSGRLNARPRIVISNNSASGALQRARREGIAHAHLSSVTHPEPYELDRAICDTLQQHDVDLVVLAGYMRKVGAQTLAAYAGRIVNIHPALLPRFGGGGMYGSHVHETVLAAGVDVTGATVHVVDAQYDHGPILAQRQVPVRGDDTVDSLARRVLEQEHDLLVETLARIASGEIVLPDRGRSAVALRIAQIKVFPKKGDLGANHRQLMSILREISEYRPDVVITPECFLDGYVVTEEWVDAGSLVQYAIDPEDSHYVADVSRWASDSGAWCILGCTTRAPDGAYNTALVLDRRGRLVGAYDKVHCQTHDQKFRSGNRLPVFSSDFGPFGVMICADRRWPETVRSLALGGARVIFNPTYGMCDARNLCMMQTRSYESEVWIAFTHPGQALVTGPRGEITTDERAPNVPFAVSEVDLTEVDRVRAGPSAHLRDRRADVYVL